MSPTGEGPSPKIQRRGDQEDVSKSRDRAEPLPLRLDPLQTRLEPTVESERANFEALARHGIVELGNRGRVVSVARGVTTVPQSLIQHAYISSHSQVAGAFEHSRPVDVVVMPDGRLIGVYNRRHDSQREADVQGVPVSLRAYSDRMPRETGEDRARRWTLAGGGLPGAQPQAPSTWGSAAAAVDLKFRHVVTLREKRVVVLRLLRPRGQALVFDGQGWAMVDELLDHPSARDITRGQLEELVATTRSLELSGDGTQIRSKERR